MCKSSLYLKGKIRKVRDGRHRLTTKTGAHIKNDMVRCAEVKHTQCTNAVSRTGSMTTHAVRNHAGTQALV